MISLKVDLSQLIHSRKELKGKESTQDCLIIPIDKNNLYKGKDGNVYLDVIGFDADKDKHKKVDYWLKQSTDKDASEEEKKNASFLGSAKYIQKGSGAKPKTEEAPTEEVSSDDLPF